MLTWTSFADGPAKGKSLTLHRSSFFLRVVVGPDDEIDALDQLDDKAMPLETIHAYRVDPKSRGTMHLDRTDPKTRRRVGEWYETATYRLVSEQPTDKVMRDAKAWAAWCQTEWQRVQAEQAKETT